MTSQIDPTKPPHTQAYTEEVRTNFLHAKQEIEALQLLVQSIIDGGQVPIPSVTNGFLLEDGSGLLMLEDGSGFLVQESE